MLVVSYLERCEILYVTILSSRSQSADCMRSRFEGGRRLGGHGEVSIFSGLPEDAVELLSAEPEEPIDTAEIRTVLAEWVRRLRGDLSLQYMVKRSVRVIQRSETIDRPSPSCVWALSGNAVMRRGHTVPIGLSGCGSGFRELADPQKRERLAWMLAAIDRAEPTPSGSFPVVLAPAAAAVLLHEAIGHFVEAAPEGRADLRHRLKVRIATELFDLWDDPLAEGGPAHYSVDDEGTKSGGSIQVVRNGCLVAMLHSVQSAEAVGASPTSNGRAASVWDTPIARMSNLVCSPGELIEEELVAGLNRGIYVHSLAYGQSFGTRLGAYVRLAEWIENGRRTERFLAGGVVDEDRGVLTRSTGLGNRSLFNDNAMCGKEGQVLYDVGTRCPAIRLQSLRLRA